VAVVAAGPAAVLAFYVFLMCCGALQRQCAKSASLPEIYSHFMPAFGLAAIFDPLLTVLVDLGLQNYSCDTRAGCRDDYTAGSCRCFEGDAFKLWRRMTDDENGGVVGVFYTIVVYAITSSLALGLLCLYLVDLHANGRIYDTYCRIFGDEIDFFLPGDFEVSLDELDLVIAKADAWRGLNGAFRTTNVSDIITHDAAKHTRIFISEVHPLDNSRYAYRSFLRSPDGTIRELFGEAARSTSSSVVPALTNTPHGEDPHEEDSDDKRDDAAVPLLQVDD